MSGAVIASDGKARTQAVHNSEAPAPLAQKIQWFQAIKWVLSGLNVWGAALCGGFLAAGKIFWVKSLRKLRIKNVFSTSTYRNAGNLVEEIPQIIRPAAPNSRACMVTRGSTMSAKLFTKLQMKGSNHG